MASTARLSWCLSALVSLCGISISFAQTAALPPPPAPPPPPKWTRSLTLGFTLTEGNSDTILFAAAFRGETKRARNEMSLGVDTTYGESEGNKNNESLRGFAQYNRLFSNRAYAYMRVDALHDAIADVEYRFTIGPGAGYYFIKNTNTTLRVEGGPSVVLEKQGHDENTFVTLRVGEKLEHKLNDRARVWEAVEALPQLDDPENFVVNAEIGLESALTRAWSLRVVLQNTYDNDPAPGRQGNDLKLITGLTWRF